MAQFHHHPDGLIYVRVGDRVYCDTSENFARDFGRSSVLPDRIIERIYDDTKIGGRHHLFDAAYNQVPGGDVPFRFGDLTIIGIDNLLKNQAERRAVASRADNASSSSASKSRNPSQFPIVTP